MPIKPMWYKDELLSDYFIGSFSKRALGIALDSMVVDECIYINYGYKKGSFFLRKTERPDQFEDMSKGGNQGNFFYVKVGKYQREEDIDK